MRVPDGGLHGRTSPGHVHGLCGAYMVEHIACSLNLAVTQGALRKCGEIKLFCSLCCVRVPDGGLLGRRSPGHGRGLSVFSCASLIVVLVRLIWRLLKRLYMNAARLSFLAVCVVFEYPMAVFSGGVLLVMVVV